MLSHTIDILLVEDNPADVRLAQETLKDYRLQNRLHIVEDGEAALSYLRREGKYSGVSLPDMVLLDIALPKVDGFEVLGQIREDASLRHLPVVVLTASSMDDQMLRTMGLETDCCVLKPLTLERFLEAVRCFPEMGLSIVRIATA